MFYLLNTDHQIDTGSLGRPLGFDADGETIDVGWSVDTLGDRDLVFRYGTSEGVFVGDVTYAPLPEPGSLGMLALGATGVLAWRTLRKRRASASDLS